MEISRDPRRGRMRALRRVVGGAAAVLVGALLTATVLAAFARYAWLADLAVHFRVQYAAGAAVACAVLFWAGRPGWAAVALGVCCMNAVLAAPVLGWSPATARASAGAPRAGPPLRIAEVNVFHYNRSYDRVVEFIRRERPDAIVLIEVTPRWLRGLQDLWNEYPHALFSGDRHRRGVLLLSRWPLERTEVIGEFARSDAPLAATLRTPGAALRIIGVHASWPITPHDAAVRERHFARLAAIARAAPRPLVVLGDLNVSGFSPHFQALLETAGLRTAARGFGWQPTWPTFLPPAGIQIDHALVSREVEVRAFRRGPHVGSDHWPIVVEVAL